MDRDSSDDTVRYAAGKAGAAWSGIGITLRPGDDVDHFRIVRHLGEGGMGVVYLARDTRLGRKVALKLISPRVFEAVGAVERFVDEARTTARFAHPHIITIYDVGEHQAAPYIALEYLEGETLEQRLHRERLGEGEAARIGRAIADALREAHRHRILHRDLKPANVFIPLDGRVRVLDFGLAQAVRHALPDDEEPPPGSEDDISLTPRGTPRYMAPELWHELPASEASDVWALGVILYEMAAGGSSVPRRGWVSRRAARGRSRPGPSAP